MTKAQKVRTLLAVVECSSIAQSMTGFESAARARNLASFWSHYQSALRSSKRDRKPRTDERTEITLEILEPAMNAVYELPTSD